jgi:hypothetical protein
MHRMSRGSTRDDVEVKNAALEERLFTQVNNLLWKKGSCNGVLNAAPGYVEHGRNRGKSDSSLPQTRFYEKPRKFAF